MHVQQKKKRKVEQERTAILMTLNIDQNPVHLTASLSNANMLEK